MTNHGEYDNGFVVMVDILGAKRIEAWRLYEICIDLENKITNLIIQHYPQGEVQHLVFNDTVAVGWKIPEPNLVVVALFFKQLQELVMNMLEIGVPLRGAISEGQYIVPKSSDSENRYLLGDAVNDAAEWYERMDLIGLIMTPKASMNVETAINNAERNPDVLWKMEIVDILLPRYNVPLSHGGSQSCRTVGWPGLTGSDSVMDGSLDSVRKLHVQQRDRFLSIFDAQRVKIPPKAIGKYNNTLEFIDWFWDYIYEMVKREKEG
jgi:hypothetical protein